MTEMGAGAAIADAPTTPAAIARLSETRGEPPWLTARRAQASERAAALPMPTLTTESWRRTDLRELDFPTLTESRGRPTTRPTGADVLALGELSGHVWLADGEALTVWCAPELSRRGVVIMPLERAVNLHTELVQRYLGQAVAADDSKFVALADAAWTNGLFVYVPRGVAVELPVLGQISSHSGAASYFRTLIVADEGAELTYVDAYRSDEEAGAALATGIVEIFAGNAARVRYANLQAWNKRTWHFNRLKAVAQRDARVDWLLVAVGGRCHRTELEASLVGQGSETDIVGLVFGDANQHFDHQTLQDHFGNDTRSDLNIKAALAGQASSTYTGLIRVNKTALRTNSNLENRNLLLSGESRAESDPRLEILNSDVIRCAHGATVGPLDPEITFYLQSRGIPPDEAQRLVVEAFFEPVLRRIPVEGIRLDAWRAIERKLGREVAADERPAEIMEGESA